MPRASERTAIALTPGVTFSQSAYGQFGDVADRVFLPFGKAADERGSQEFGAEIRRHIGNCSPVRCNETVAMAVNVIGYRAVAASVWCQSFRRIDVAVAVPAKDAVGTGPVHRKSVGRTRYVQG